MPQDISSEDEDHHLVESLNTRNHVIDHKDATELEKVVKNTILEAKYEDGTLPNPRYMNLTAEEERQLELDELLWFAAEHNELDLALQALKDGANVSSRNSAYLNQTAMHCAAQFQTGHPDMLELLARHGGDVNARNCYNSTPLHEAAYWAYGPAVKKLLELGADVFVLNARSLTPLLNAEGNWAAVARPCVALTEISNASMFIWEHETKGGWRHRLRDPEQRKEVVDMLKEAMGNRSYGRGADPYCGGVDFPDEWEDWDEEAEHYNPLSRPREFKSSLPPCRSPLEEKVHKHEWNCAFENDIQKEIDSLWQRDKWRYYQRFPDEPMSGEEIGQGSESSDSERHELGREDQDSGADSGKDEGRLITRFDSHGPAAQNYDAALLNDGFGDDEGPMMDDDGEDAEGAPQQPK